MKSNRTVHRNPARHGVGAAFVLATLSLGASLGCGGGSRDPNDDSLGTSASALEATEDDLAWVTRTLPVVLGRHARGAGELLALANATEAIGKQRVLDHLMDSDEFVERWSGFFLERLRVGREAGNGWEHAACYEAPMGANRDAWEGAARTVRNHGPQSPQPAGAGTFVMADVLRGAISLDDAIPIYRAFPFALVQRASSTEPDFPETQRQAERGDIYTQTVLNKSTTCMECHHTKYSSTPGTFLLPSGAPSSSLAQPYESLVFPVRRTEPGPRLVVQGWATGFSPRGASDAPFPGWSTSRCGGVGRDGSPSDLGSALNGFITGMGATPTVWKVDAAFVEGYRRLPASFASPSNGPDMAMMMLAASFANDVWREVMGKPLTIPNFVSRNSAQFTKLRALANVATAGAEGERRLSLRAVLSTILTSREWTGSVHAAAADVFEPFLDGPDVFADRVHRHSADVLFRSAAFALGKPAPTHFPRRTGTFPTLSVAAATGLSLSPTRREAPTVSLEGMLGWEDQVAKCDSGTSPDFMGALFRHATSRAGLRLRDLVDATKMRITGAPIAAAEEPSLTAFFGTSLDGAYASSQDATLRGLCRVLLRSPDFMLAGGPLPPLSGVATMQVSTAGLDGAGNLAVEDELTACRAWGLDSAGTYNCDPVAREEARRLWERLFRVCPRGRCAFFEEPRFRFRPPVCLSCPPWQDILTEAPPRLFDPRDKLALPAPSIPQSGGVFLAYAPKAKVVTLSKSIPYFDKQGKLYQLAVGQHLQEGDSFVVEEGLKFRLESAEGGVFESDGLPAAPDKGRFSFMIGGPEALVPENLPTVSTPMSPAELEAAAAEKHALIANEPGSQSIVHTVTAPIGNVSYLDDPAANGHPEAVLIVTKRSGAAARRLGAWYDAGRARWAIYDESRAALPVGLLVNVRVLPPSATAYVHRAVKVTLSGHITYLDHPRLNGHPEASIQVTHQYAPPGSPGIYDDHPLGAWYDTARQRWSIYHEDFSPMVENVAFDVKMGSLVTVTASQANLVDGALRVDDLAAAPPSAIVFLTHNYAPMGVGGAYHGKEVGIRFDTKTSSWLVENLDRTPIPIGVAFNVHRAP